MMEAEKSLEDVMDKKQFVVSHNQLGRLLVAARTHAETYTRKPDSEESWATYEAECEAYQACLEERLK